jgi:pyruvate/2-oxoglutarate dehydrogenase complex dihydrolipoamide dehydrogenase (E3) component
MYDLVIIGASPEGISAAQQGIKKFPTSRIALITQGWETLWAERELPQKFNDLCSVETEPEEILRQLAALGVDVILESGHFNKTEVELVWQVSQRELKANAYLLTTNVKQYQATHNALIKDNLFSPPKNSSEAKTWAIWGALPQNLILTQTLAQQGNSVQLFTRNSHLLPGEDREMSHLLQCYLETMGIKIWPNCHRFTPHFNADHQTYQLSIVSPTESQEITVDALWRSPKDPFRGAPLPELLWHWEENLSGPREISINDTYLAVNDYLQTTHPQIFACGGWLKGYTSEAIAQKSATQCAIQEAHYVVDRVLGKIRQPINYAQIPFGIDLNPPWYRVGLNQQEATQQLKNIHVYYGYEPCQAVSTLRGLCKIITNEQDKVLGAHWFGESAKAGISLLTLAITKALTVVDLQNLPVVESDVAQVLQDLSRR